MTAPQMATVGIEAPADQVWAILVDVGAWPDWTPSMRKVVPTSAGPLAVGSTASVTQPRLGTSTWQVTELEPGRSFTWVSHRPGVTTYGRHVLTPRPGGCTVRLEIEQQGPLAPLVTPLTAGLTQRYLDAEAEGLKRASELIHD